MMTYLNKTNQKGFAAIVLVVGVIFVVLLVAGYFYFSQTGETYPGKEYVDKYTATNETTISDSDDPDVIEEEFEETELMLDDFEKDLDALDSELEQL